MACDTTLGKGGKDSVLTKCTLKQDVDIADEVEGTPYLSRRSRRLDAHGARTDMQR